MKHITRNVFILFFILLGFSLYTTYATPSTDKPVTTPTATSTPVVTTPDPLLEELKSMSTAEKIGSLLIMGFRGYMPDEHIKTLIETYHVGGVNLLKWNIQNAEQVQNMTTELQSLYAKSHKHPFIIAADQEGGTVVRFNFLKEKTAQPNIRTLEDAARITENRAKELRTLGINMNFALVVDFITNTRSYLYNRTFATTSEGTISLGQQIAETYLKHGIMPVYKHFPGYGNSSINPHTAVTTFDGSAELFEQNIQVFKTLLSAHSDIPVMTAHIIVPQVSSVPATKSKKFMTDMIRNDFNYTGVIITDDMDMASVGADQGKNAVDAILAGADILISTPNDTNHLVIIKALQKAVADGIISQERLDQSVYRVLQMRARLEK